MTRIGRGGNDKTGCGSRFYQCNFIIISNRDSGKLSHTRKDILQ